jgi:hypothetical protein
LLIGLVPPAIESAAAVAADPHPATYAQRGGERLNFAGDIRVIDDQRRVGVLQNAAMICS